MPTFLCIDLANSYWGRDANSAPVDYLDDPGLAAEVGIQLHELAAPSELQPLKVLREPLKALFWAISTGERELDDLLRPFNEILAAAPAVQQLVWHEGKFVVQAAGSAADLRTRVARSVVRLLAEHDPARLRVCENPQCRWVFYDETKSGTHRCCDEVCRDRLRVQRFRAKRRAGGEGAAAAGEIAKEGKA